MCMSIIVCVFSLFFTSEHYFLQVVHTVRSGPRIFGSGNYIYAHCLHVSVFKLAGVEDWHNKIVYLFTDGASINLGKDNGVATKLR